VGLFGFQETTKAPLVPATIVVELAGAVVLFALAVRELRPQLQTGRHGGAAAPVWVPPRAPAPSRAVGLP
jgi:hypothetical protein